MDHKLQRLGCLTQPGMILADLSDVSVGALGLTDCTYPVHAEQMNTLTIADYAISPHSPLFPKVVPVCRRLSKVGCQIAQLLTTDWLRVPSPTRDSRLIGLNAQFSQLYEKYDALHVDAGIKSSPLPSYYLSARATAL